MSDRADGKFNVLIIDDSAFQVKQISKMLEAQNFNVVGNASDGVEGLKLLAKATHSSILAWRIPWTV